MTDVVLICGRQGSGKTSTAGALIRESKRLGYTFAGVEKFAAPLYELHEYILNKMATWTGTTRISKNGFLLQILGTDFGRQYYGDDVWVNILKNKVAVNTKGTTNKRLVVIDDCRFENEFDAFPEALRVRLFCIEEDRKDRAESWRDNTNHPSETGLDAYTLQEKFDLNIDTSYAANSTPEHVATLILAQLQKRSWIEKRNHLTKDTPCNM